MPVSAGIWQRLANAMRPESAKCPMYISDHTARDIGMTLAELERHRFVWPTDSEDRPLL